jgi:hypothetical protein
LTPPVVTAPNAQYTDFSIDVLGRYTCNGLDEALRSTDRSQTRPNGELQLDARPFDVVVVGGGSFGPIFAQHLLYQDARRSHRILVLEAGPLSLPEHVQNLPMIGLGVPGATTVDSGRRSEVWGLPWRSDVGFPGLAYTLGGRSIFFGGWAPELLESETTTWPAAVLADLRNEVPNVRDSYFRQASEQIGVTESNDFIFGDLQRALRERLFAGISAGNVTDAIPLNSADLPLHLDPADVPAGKENEYKLEAPLAVQGRAPRAGFFPLNKFSSLPLLMEGARAATYEAFNDDVKKRLMVVPECHVTRLETAPAPGGIKVVNILTSKGSVPIPEGGVVVMALGTIESARLALISFPLLSNAGLVGTNLMAHLRSNLTIRIPRSSLPANLTHELQAAALFVKGRHDFADGHLGHFHLQITASGVATPTVDSEAELFKKNPDVDLFSRQRKTTDTTVVITIRGIGEMQPHNPASRVSLAGDTDEFTLPRAWVSLKPGPRDGELWDVMDRAADDVALVLSDGKPYEILVGGTTFVSAAAGKRPADVLAFPGRRDGIGTTHHEAGTLWMGEDANTSVTDSDGRFHHVENAYALGPALHPSVGSPNPMLTGTALARRLADKLAPIGAHVSVADSGFQLLFDGTSLGKWRMSTIKNQPGRDDPGRFFIVDGALEAAPGTDLGMLWYTEPAPADYVLKLEWLQLRDDDNSGVFVRFPDPDSKGYDNTAWVASNFGFEVQIDQLARTDGKPVHLTGAIYGFAPPKDPTALPVRPPGDWNVFEIRVQGQTYDVKLNGVAITHFVNTDGARGLPTAAGRRSFVGLQTHTGRVRFRNIQLKSL